MRPLLFLDVDGTLIPFGGNDFGEGGDPLLARLNPGHGWRLLMLRCELVWATTWMQDANDAICPRLGLPELPVVEWSDADPPEAGLHWKTSDLVDWAAGRPFVWVDDEITDVDRAWVAAHHTGPAYLHRVDPGVGLTEDDFAALRSALENWTRGV